MELMRVNVGEGGRAQSKRGALQTHSFSVHSVS